MRVPMPAWVVVGLSLATRVAWLAAGGFRRGHDTGYYLRAADALLAGGFPGMLEAVGGSGKYTSSILVLAALRALFGDSAAQAWVVLGIVASTAAALPLYFLARDLFGERAALVAGVMYASCFDLFQWSSYALTDTLFVSAAVTFVWLLVAAARRPTRALVLASVASGLIVATMRVSGTATVVAALLALVLLAGWRRLSGVPAPARIAVGGAVALAGAVVAIVALGVLNPYLPGYYAAGHVVDDDPATSFHFAAVHPEGGGLLAFILANPGASATLVLLKALAFWTVFSPHYSVAHILVNVVTLLPVVALGWGAIVALALRRGGPDHAVVPAAVVVGLWVFHALTVVDYDFRYRAPLLPLLAVFAGAGVDRALAWSARWRRTPSQRNA